MDDVLTLALVNCRLGSIPCHCSWSNERLNITAPFERSVATSSDPRIAPRLETA
jgi:hypothetical protein